MDDGARQDEGLVCTTPALNQLVDRRLPLTWRAK